MHEVFCHSGHYWTSESVRWTGGNFVLGTYLTDDRGIAEDVLVLSGANSTAVVAKLWPLQRRDQVGHQQRLASSVIDAVQLWRFPSCPGRWLVVPATRSQTGTAGSVRPLTSGWVRMNGKVVLFLSPPTPCLRLQAQTCFTARG